MLTGNFLPSAGEFSKMAPVDNMNRVIKTGGSEVRSGAHIMAGVADEAAFDFGMSDWNFLVFNFVPAQVFGSSFKQKCLFKFDSPMMRGGSGGYEVPNGSTVTGVCDCFASFGYLGFVKFLLIGWVLGTLYNGALKGNWGAAILYICLIVTGLEAITHETPLFLTRIVYICIFAMPALRYAKSRDLTPRDFQEQTISPSGVLPVQPVGLRAGRVPQFPGARLGIPRLLPNWRSEPRPRFIRPSRRAMDFMRRFGFRRVGQQGHR
jgi:hypothetical protein